MENVISVSVETIASVLKNSDGFNYPDTIDYGTAHALNFVFDQLDSEKNYSFMFKKNRQYWSAAKWKTVASDVKKHLNY